MGEGQVCGGYAMPVAPLPPPHTLHFFFPTRVFRREDAHFDPEVNSDHVMEIRVVRLLVLNYAKILHFVVSDNSICVPILIAPRLAVL